MTSPKPLTDETRGTPSRRTRGRALGLVTLVLVVALVPLLVPLPRSLDGRCWGTLLDLGHIPLFAALTLALWGVLRGPWYRPVAIAIFVAGLVEIVQPHVGRTGDLLDFLRGGAAALAAGVAVRACQGPRTPARLALHALAALVVLAWPVGSAGPRLLDAYEEWRSFPILADFTAPRRMLRWHCQQADLERLPDPRHPGEWAGRLEFRPGPQEYPGAALTHDVRDWTGYRRLCWSFTVEGDPLTLSFSIRGHPGAETNHYDTERTFAAGEHCAEVDLAAAAEQARPGRLDLAEIWQSLVFVIRPRGPRTIYLHRVWLE